MKVVELNSHLFQWLELIGTAGGMENDIYTRPAIITTSPPIFSISSTHIPFQNRAAIATAHRRHCRSEVHFYFWWLLILLVLFYFAIQVECSVSRLCLTSLVGSWSLKFFKNNNNNNNLIGSIPTETDNIKVLVALAL